MHPDHRPYARFASPAVLEKAINSLLGLVEGIAIDGSISADEVSFLNVWLEQYAAFEHLHPFSELVPLVKGSVSDGQLSEDERADITWLCRKLVSDEFYDQVTVDLQRLHAVLGGIVSDGRVTEHELRGLSEWLQEHEHLRRSWPYDEIDSLITTVMQDKVIDPEEQRLLMRFFSEFTTLLDDRTVTSPVVEIAGSVSGLCAVCPEIRFPGEVFCFTGASSRYQRKDLDAIVQGLGGKVAANPSGKLSYLVVGAEGNPAWSYACYGRKVEAAVRLRKGGAKLLIVHENDFHDAVEDHRR